MKFELTFHPELIELVATGPASLTEMGRLVGEVLGHPRWRPGSLVLADYTRLDASSLTLADIQRIATTMTGLRHRFGEIRLAYVVRRDLEFGLVRMWEAFVEWDGTVGIFRSRDEALAWLLDPGRP